MHSWNMWITGKSDCLPHLSLQVGQVIKFTCQMCHELPLTEILPKRAPAQQPLTSQEGRTQEEFKTSGARISQFFQARAVPCPCHAGKPPHLFFLNHYLLQLHEKLRHQHSKKAKGCSTRDFLPLLPDLVFRLGIMQRQSSKFKKFNASQKHIFKEIKSIISVKWLWGSWVKSITEILVPRLCLQRVPESLSYCCDLLLGRLWHAWTPHKQNSLAMHNNRSLKLPILAFFISKYRPCQHAGTWNTAMLVTGYLHHLNSGGNTSAHPPLCYLTHFCWLNIHQWHFQWTHPHSKLLVYCY